MGWPARELDVWRVWESENGPVWCPEVDRQQRAWHLAMYATAHGVRGAEASDYLPPWQQPKRRDSVGDEEIIKAVKKFNEANK